MEEQHTERKIKKTISIYLRGPYVHGMSQGEVTFTEAQ